MRKMHLERHPNIRRLMKVEFTPQELKNCVCVVEARMREAGSHNTIQRIDLADAYFRNHDKAMAYTIRMHCMMELMRTPIGLEVNRKDPVTRSASVAVFHAAALAPLHYDDKFQFFKESEFFAIVELERGALLQG